MRRVLSPGWLVLHALALAMAIACLWLGWWQVGRARAGNVLSFGYALQWPIFSGFIVFMWFRMVRQRLHEDPSKPPPPAAPAPQPREVTSREYAANRADPAELDDDPELAAYNRYLTWLNADPRRRPSDYPG